MAKDQLTDEQQNDLLERFALGLRTRSPVGFISLCYEMEIPTDRYKATLEQSEVFRDKVEALEQDKIECLTEWAIAKAVSEDGRPMDALNLVERTDPAKMGKKKQEADAFVSLFDRFTAEELDSERDSLGSSMAELIYAKQERSTRVETYEKKIKGVE